MYREDGIHWRGLEYCELVNMEGGIHLRGFRVLLVSVQGGRYSFEGG